MKQRCKHTHMFCACVCVLCICVLFYEKRSLGKLNSSSREEKYAGVFLLLASFLVASLHYFYVDFFVIFCAAVAGVYD